MAESLFTTQTPATLNANDSQAYTLGTVITLGVAGNVTHGRWYFPATLPTGSVSWVLYDLSTQAELARAAFSIPTAGAWNTVALGSPVAAIAGRQVVACIETQDRYVVTGGFFGTALTNGNLTAPADAAVANGRFTTAHAAFPTGSSGAGCYFVDLVFDTGAAGASVSPDGLAIGVAVGSPAASAAVAAAPAGLAVAVAAGAPAVAWSGAVAPDGMAVVVAVGSPVVGAAPTAPAGVTVPVAVGTPALSWVASVAPGGVVIPVHLGVPVPAILGEQKPGRLVASNATPSLAVTSAATSLVSTSSAAGLTPTTWP